MRYTTIIDVSTMAAIYRNHNCRLVYLHLVLKSGYHDADRDLISVSIRTLAADVGLTVSAVRHALALLTKAQLVERQGELWHVKKWLLDEPITSRPKTRREVRARQYADERNIANQMREAQAEEQRKHREELERSGKTDFMVWYEKKLELAAAGDVDAQRAVAKNKAVYDAHRSSMAQRKGGVKR